LVAAGAVCGSVVALLAPARYVSEALVSFENVNSDRAAILMNDAVNGGMRNNTRLSGSRRNLTWQQVELGGTKTDVFRIQFVGGNPGFARSVLQDVLGYIDRGITSLHGGDDNQFEEIRGVDGALLPVLDPVAGQTVNGGMYSPKLAATEPAPQIAIPFDDERAKAVGQPEYRAVRMNLIDPPSFPEHSKAWAGGRLPSVLCRAWHWPF
jgi:hypothetical protein